MMQHAASIPRNSSRVSRIVREDCREVGGDRVSLQYIAARVSTSNHSSPGTQMTMQHAASIPINESIVSITMPV